MGNKYTLYLYPKAAQDLESIFDYIAYTLLNKTAAFKQIDDFEKAFAVLCEFPYSSPLVSNAYIEDKTVRKTVVNNYIAFYKVNEELRQIEIVRVLYGMMDYVHIL